MVSAVKMMYDGSGNRVKKEVITPAPSVPWGSGMPLEISKLGTDVVVDINKNGTIATALPIVENSADPAISGSLEFSDITGADPVSMSISETSIYTTGDLTRVPVRSSQTGDLEAAYAMAGPAMVWQAGPNDIIAGNGQFDVQGDFVSGVAYVEGSHVFERNEGEGAYQLAYVNFAEGKTIGTADDRVYYLKDHLGSTRMTLASDLTKKEAIVYKAYGSEMVVDNVPATDILRARFTGKELDKE
jgi:hypothetical protein